MNFADLSKFDIKDLQKIDVAKVQENIMAKPDLALNIALAVVSCFIMFNIYNGRHTELQGMNTKIEEMEKKITAIDKYSATQKKLNEFIESLPKGIQAESIIDKITDFATMRDVQIISFMPAQKEAKKLYDKININLNVTAPSYNQMLLFIQDIENAPYALRVDKWTGYMETEQGTTKTDKTEATPPTEAINAQVGVTSINFKK